jgi:DNA-binding response OmpR family regulator
MKRVLSIGQCGFDHGQISALLRREFGAETVAAHTLQEAEHRLQGEPPALILVNRKLDIDGGDGMEIIGRLLKDEKSREIPVMLVSNYPQYQAEAGALGAQPGFGKSELGTPATLDKLRPYLA